VDFLLSYTTNQKVWEFLKKTNKLDNPLEISKPNNPENIQNFPLSKQNVYNISIALTKFLINHQFYDIMLEIKNFKDGEIMKNIHNIIISLEYVRSECILIKKLVDTINTDLSEHYKIKIEYIMDLIDKILEECNQVLNSDEKQVTKLSPW